MTKALLNLLLVLLLQLSENQCVKALLANIFGDRFEITFDFAKRIYDVESLLYFFNLKLTTLYTMCKIIVFQRIARIIVIRQFKLHIQLRLVIPRRNGILLPILWIGKPHHTVLLILDSNLGRLRLQIQD
ncbi:hypothetical protein D3C74_379100 [compost metagenome]